MKLMQLTESTDKITLVELPYSTKDLEPVMDKGTVEYHYKVLSAGYVDRFNKQEGDIEFNKAGALLHNIWWPQLRSPKIYNAPKGTSADFIRKHFDDFDNFKDTFNDIAAKIQGSGWCYLAKDGNIKTIANHKWKSDIILLIDCWEHAANQYEVRKDYLKKIWRLINWDVINDRLNASSV